MSKQSSALNLCEGSWALSEVGKSTGICTKPWFSGRHRRLLIEVSGVRVSLGFSALVLPRPDPHCKSNSHFLCKLILAGAQQLLGRADLALLPWKKGTGSVQPFTTPGRAITPAPGAALKTFHMLRYRLGFPADIWRHGPEMFGL